MTTKTTKTAAKKIASKKIAAKTSATKKVADATTSKLLPFNAEKLADTTIIVRLAAKCPRKAGSKAAANWKRYAPKMSYADFCAAGGTVKQLRFDARRGYVQLGGKK